MKLGSHKILGAAADVFFTLVLLVSVLAAIAALGFRGGPSAVRFGTILSPSMAASGYDVGDVVYVDREDGYDRGDVIVFYRADEATYARPFDGKARTIWVHEIIDVRTDETGRRAYLTKGSSNADDDGRYVPEDFVLGRAVRLPGWLSALLGFASTARGILCLVVVPCAVMLVLLTRELVLILLEPVPVSYWKKTFTARLALAPPAVRARYCAVKNALLSYEAARARMSAFCETFRVHGRPFAKIGVRGGQLLIYFALPPERAVEKKFGAEDVSAVKKFAGFPCRVRVRSDRAAAYARILAERTAGHNGFVRGMTVTDSAAPSMTKRQLKKSGHLKRAEYYRHDFPAGEKEKGR